MLLTLANPACSSLDATVHNLEELHPSETRHARSAALMGGFEYRLRQGLSSMMATAGTRTRMQTKDAKQLDDPHKECLENLIALAHYDAQDVVASGRQTEWFTRLASLDPWTLSRERAVLELGKAGERLSIGLPAALLPEAEPVQAVEVGAAIAELVRIAGPPIAGEGPVTSLEEFESICQRFESWTLDLDGARRSLRVLTDLLGDVEFGERSRAALSRACLHVQGEAVRQALDAALRDEEPVVRAAAVQSTVRSASYAALDAFLLQLRRDSSPLVTQRVLQLVARRGLPPASDLPPGKTMEELEYEWLRALYGVAVQHVEGQVRVAAMRALETVSDSQLNSLREEDWQAWWHDYRSARERGGPRPEGLEPEGPGPEGLETEDAGEEGAGGG